MSRAEELINDSIVTAGRQKRPMFASFDDATRIIKELEERLKDIPCKRDVATDKLCESVAELQMQNEALEEMLVNTCENLWRDKRCGHLGSKAILWWMASPEYRHLEAQSK